MIVQTYKFPIVNELTERRFLNKCAQTSHGCWEWKGGITIWGYGQFWMAGKEYGAHRVSYYLLKKVNPGNLFVLHRCDNRKCVNPEHLYLGTQKDNVHDVIKKGRFDPKRISSDGVRGNRWKNK